MICCTLMAISATANRVCRPPGRRRIVLIALLAFLPIAHLLPLAVPDSLAAESDDGTISSFRINISRLQQGIAVQEDQMADSRSKERNLLEDMEAIDSKLMKQQEKLHDLEKKRDMQQVLIDREENALQKIRDKRAAVEEHLKKRMKAYYSMGNIGLLNVTFSTRTLPELLSFHDAFNTLIEYDQNVIRKYQETMKEIERTKSALDLEKAVLEDFIEQVVEENNNLEQTKNEKEQLLTQIRTKEQLHKQAIAEMQKASEELSQSIVSIKSKNEVTEQGFLANKGSLPPPVDGVIITLFNQEKVNALGIARKVRGIELKAPDGTTIKAVAGGEVTFSGYLRGYGNTVIIHHGLQYYTVTARIEKLLVEKGQRVEAGSPIGVMGDTAVLFDEGLYFEIRHGRQAMDPLIWLNPNRLTAQHEHTPEPSGKEDSILQ